jgi:hypothetical protein
MFGDTNTEVYTQIAMVSGTVFDNIEPYILFFLGYITVFFLATSIKKLLDIRKTGYFTEKGREKDQWIGKMSRDLQTKGVWSKKEAEEELGKEGDLNKDTRDFWFTDVKNIWFKK